MTTELSNEQHERTRDLSASEPPKPGSPAAGFEIVATDRLERLTDASAAAKEFTDTLFLLADVSNDQAATIVRDLGVRIAEAVLRLQPGDLDPLDPVAAGEGRG